MKVIIAGSRDWLCSYNRMQEVIKEAGFPISEVVSGGARGIDAIGEAWAEAENIPVSRFPADWQTFGRAAGPRNKKMAEYADALIALWDGKSKGTLNMINCMRQLKKPYHVIALGNVKLIDLEKSK